MDVQTRLESSHVLVLDGAIGTEVERLGGEMDSTAWCALANKTHPDVVREVHKAYLNAGADIIAANTFATCRHNLAAIDLADEAAALTRRAVQLAREAIDEVAADRDVIVAGSMSNNVAWIPDTTSPDPRFLPNRRDEAANYREMAEALAQGGADVILLEMMLDTDRSCMLAEAAKTAGLPLWIGISAALTEDDQLVGFTSHLVDPESWRDPSHPVREPLPLEAIIDALRAFDPQVMGIMHTTAKATGPALECLRSTWSGPTLSYPEAGNQAYIEPAAFAKYCRQWAEEGVQIIGGCCGTTVDHIRAMVDALPERGM